MGAKLCLIPPTAHLDEFAKGGMHLLLNHLLEDKTYFNYYRARYYHWGDYLILDNGAHEEVPSTIEDLVRKAEMVGASEIVWPDAKYDLDRTIGLFEMTVHSLRNMRMLGYRRWMLVPQGSDIMEWTYCLHYMVGRWQTLSREIPQLFGKAPIIGFPMKYTDGTFSDHDVTLAFNFLNDLNVRYPIKVHLLGWDRSPFEWVPRLVKAPFVRSVDTAKPFVLTLAGKHAGPMTDFPRRPDNYFEATMEGDLLDLARWNVNAFLYYSGNKAVLGGPVRGLPPGAA